MDDSDIFALMATVPSEEVMIQQELQRQETSLQKKPMDKVYDQKKSSILFQLFVWYFIFSSLDVLSQSLLDVKINPSMRTVNHFITSVAFYVLILGTSVGVWPLSITNFILSAISFLSLPVWFYFGLWPITLTFGIILYLLYSIVFYYSCPHDRLFEYLK
jgi:hypothetical protein